MADKADWGGPVQTDLTTTITGPGTGFILSTLNTQLSTPGVGRVLRLVTPDCHLLSSPLIPVAASHKVRHTLLSNKAFYLNF